MVIDELPVPEPGPSDVLVRVHACGIVPNLANILKNWTTWFPERPLPPLPAVFGLDPAGEIVAVGSQVHAWRPGQRVYVNAGRHCGGCRACRDGRHADCEYYAFNGYFGFSEKSLALFEHYPDGGLAEFMVAPQYALVELPDDVTYDQAARFGYLGTVYSAMRKTAAGPGYDQAAAVTPGSDEEALHTLQLTIEELLAPLPTSHRAIIELRAAGHEVADIAARTGRSRRSVERILHDFRRRLHGLVHEPD